MICCGYFLSEIDASNINDLAHWFKSPGNHTHGCNIVDVRPGEWTYGAVRDLRFICFGDGHSI